MVLKRNLTVVTLLLMVVLITVACNSGGEETKPTQAEVENPTQAILEGDSSESPTSEPVSISPTSSVAEIEITSYVAKDPISGFTQEDIDQLGVNCQGSEEEIANCILNWQGTNMTYCGEKEGFDDCTDPIRANYFLPGIYPTSELIRERVKDDKVYGICWDFSTIYCSIAGFYGLDCRVINSISKPSEREGTYVVVTHGMSEEEYQRLKVKLDQNDLPYGYEPIRLVAAETPGHYWAEIQLNGEWVVMDGSRSSVGGSTQTEYIDAGDFEVTNWLATDRTVDIVGYALREAQGEDLRGEGYASASEQFMEGREVAETYGTAEDYEGITDFLGQTGRSASISDFMQGLGLMPYFNTCNEICEFTEAGDDCAADCPEEDEIKACYETCSGEPYYLGCTFITDEEEIDPEVYKACSGVPLNVACENSCVD